MIKGTQIINIHIINEHPFTCPVDILLLHSPEVTDSRADRQTEIKYAYFHSDPRIYLSKWW